MYRYFHQLVRAQVFEQFLSGGTLEECYSAVGAVANRWLDLLDTRGEDLTDEELIGYISEATTMSKALAEYEGERAQGLGRAWAWAGQRALQHNQVDVRRHQPLDFSG